MAGEFPNYNITAPATIRVTVSGPPVLSTASRRRQVFAYFVVRATAGRAWLTGGMDEASFTPPSNHWDPPCCP